MGKGPAKSAIALRPRASGLLRPRAAALRIEHKECARQGVRGGSTDGGACGLTWRGRRGGRVEGTAQSARPAARCPERRTMVAILGTLGVRSGQTGGGSTSKYGRAAGPLVKFRQILPVKVWVRCRPPSACRQIPASSQRAPEASHGQITYSSMSCARRSITG